MKINKQEIMYGVISKKKINLHIEQIKQIFNNLQSYQTSDKSLIVSKKIAQTLLKNILSNKKKKLQARIKLYKIATKFHDAIGKLEDSISHQISHSLLAIAHMADFCATDNVASFKISIHDADHAYRFIKN